MTLLLSRLLCVVCLALPLWAGDARFWTRSEGPMQITFGEGFKLSLKDSDREVTLQIKGPDGRTEGLRSAVAYPIGMGEFCVREREGEGEDGDPSVWLNALEESGGGIIPVGHARIGAWQFWDLQWDVHGCGIAGLFRSEVIVGRHGPSGTWVTHAGFGTGLAEKPAPNEGEPLFRFTPAKRTANNCWVQEAWRFVVRNGRAEVVVEAPRYFWFGGHTLADTPVEARHWAHQEVAWHLASVSEEGGVAQAFAASPRPASEYEGIIPPPGRTPFQWRPQILVVGKDGQRRIVDRPAAIALASQGGWDVVLERRSGRPMATWLVEHEKDFPHSTPPRP